MGEQELIIKVWPCSILCDYRFLEIIKQFIVAAVAQQCDKINHLDTVVV